MGEEVRPGMYRYKICDFGLSRDLSAGTDVHDQDGEKVYRLTHCAKVPFRYVYAGVSRMCICLGVCGAFLAS